MKLLMITGLGSVRDLVSDKRGAFYYTLEEFSKYWERIDIISPKVEGFDSGVKTIFGNVFVHISPRPLIFHPFWFLKKGVEIYKAQKFNLVTVQEYPPFYNGIGARLLWSKIQVPYVLEIHHVPGYPKAADFRERLYKTATRYFIKYDAAKAVAVRVVNQHQVPEFLIRAGVPADKIKYIPSAYIDLAAFKPMNVEKKYDLVFAGRLEKNKNIAGLIEAVRIVKKSKPDVKLLIIGSGPELNRIKLLTTHYELQTNVVFSGWLKTQNDLAATYNSARVFINPSLNEGGPRVVLEAMACGLPVITTRVGLVADIVKDGETGLLSDWSPGQMAQKILFLLGDIELQARFSAVGIKLVQQFEKKTAIKNWAEKLKGLI